MALGGGPLGGPQGGPGGSGSHISPPGPGPGPGPGGNPGGSPGPSCGPPTDKVWLTGKFGHCTTETVTINESSWQKNILKQNKKRDIKVKIGDLTIQGQYRERRLLMQQDKGRSRCVYGAYRYGIVPALMENIISQVVSEYGYYMHFTMTEYYKCIDTQWFYIDLRYNNAVFKRTTELLDFNKQTDEVATFKGQGGVIVCNFLKMKDVKYHQITEWVQIRNGVEVVIQKTETDHDLFPETGYQNIVFPNAPGLGIPTSDNVKTEPFYDYNSADELLGGPQTIADGGKDYYWPDWLKQMGKLNQTQDFFDRDERYMYWFLRLSNQHPTTGVTYIPPMATGTYMGSMATDQNGKLFTSQLVENGTYNFLEDGNIFNLIGLTGDNPIIKVDNLVAPDKNGLSALDAVGNNNFGVMYPIAPI